MRKVKPNGIQVLPTSAPNFGARGHWGDTTRTIINGDLPQNVSFGHRSLINGLLIPACDLVNESSITRIKSTSSDVLEYLHIELDDHDVILASGVPAETL